MRLAFVQYGDYREVFLRFRKGGGETYYAQRYSVDFVANLTRRAEFVGVCSTLGGDAYEEEMAPGLWSARAPLIGARLDTARICSLLEKWRITHLVLTTPSAPILSWALANRIATLPLLADSFPGKGLRGPLQASRLAQLLNNPAIRVVGNHNVPASLSLKAIGVDPARIYPWDWPAAVRPEGRPPKKLGDGPARLVFVGAMRRAKGPGDCIAAAKHLKKAGIDFRMVMIGGGPYLAAARRLAASLGVADRVDLKGPLMHAEAVAALEEATFSLVTTRHEYAEGLPMTIYESLATRTPLIMSDHPMFLHYFTDAAPVRLVPEKSPGALAEAAIAWLSDPGRYHEASVATADLWTKIQCDLKWGDLLDAWLNDPEAPAAALRGHALQEQVGRLL